VSSNDTGKNASGDTKITDTPLYLPFDKEKCISDLHKVSSEGYGVGEALEDAVHKTRVSKIAESCQEKMEQVKKDN
jgi:hypothetical protein